MGCESYIIRNINKEKYPDLNFSGIQYNKCSGQLSMSQYDFNMPEFGMFIAIRLNFWVEARKLLGTNFYQLNISFRKKNSFSEEKKLDQAAS